MNKKQSIVAWVMIVSIAIAIARTIFAIPESGFTSIIEFYYLLVFILIIGGILIFILRDKKK